MSGVGDASFNGAFYVASVPSATTFVVAQAGPNATSGGGSAITLNQGGAVTGGCFYDSSAVPASYRGNYFYGDLNSGRVNRATFDTQNEVTSVDYFVSGLSSPIDTTVGRDGALYYIEYGGRISRLAWTNYSAQQLVVTPMNVWMFENGKAAASVRLAKAPASDVEVSVTRTSVDPAIHILSGSNLVFTTGNWSVPQTVQIEAAADGDTTNGVGFLQVVSTGLASETITIHAIDTIKPFSVGPVTGSGPGLFPVRVGLSGETGKTYILEAATNVSGPWTAISTNNLASPSTNILDPNSSIIPQRAYRARLSGT